MNLEDDLGAHYLNLGFSENFLCDANDTIQVQLPYPINKPLKNAKIDVIHKYNEDLETHNNQLTNLKKDFDGVKHKILDQSFSNTHATVTKGLLNYCNREKLRVAFTCDYNPFYTTGILEHFNLGDSSYLIRPDCENILRITNIAKPWKNYKCNVEKPFEEAITGISSNNDFGKVSLLIKQKNEINLAQIEDIKRVAKILFTKTFKLNVIDAKLGKNKVGLILSNSKFSLYDLETEKKMNLSDFDFTSAIRLEFIDENNVAILSQKNIKIFDLRSTDYKMFEPQIDSCNYLCCAAISNDLLYLGTRHHLIRSDVRFLKNVEFCTHLLKFSPCYIDLADDILCLSSQKVDEKVLFCGSPISSLPINVPSICDGFKKYQLEKDILLTDEIENMFQKSIGGIKIISDDKETFLYSVNSLGNMYKQKITSNTENDELEPIENLEKWINNLPQSPKPLHLTNVVNLSDARFSLNKSVDQRGLRKFNNTPKKVDSFLNHFKNYYHEDHLGELAKNFLSIWDETEEEEEREEVNLVPEVAPLDKVHNWIESSYFFE